VGGILGTRKRLLLAGLQDQVEGGQVAVLRAPSCRHGYSKLKADADPKRFGSGLCDGQFLVRDSRDAYPSIWFGF
jgi:hypothetical protein